MVEIHRRARHLRRQRLATRAGGVVVVLSLIAAVTLSVWPQQPRALIAPAGVGGKDCQNTILDTTITKQPQLAYLPAPSLAPRLDHVTASRIVEDCSYPPAQAVWYSTAKDGTVTKRLDVSGPDYPAPGKEMMARIKPELIDLDGRTGVMKYIVHPGFRTEPDTLTGWVWWSEKDGSSWWANSAQMTRAELIQAVTALKVVDGRVDPGHRPPGLTETLPAYTGPTSGAGDAQVDLAILPGKRVSQKDPHLVVSEVRDESWQAGTGARPLTVNGQPGWMTVSGEGENRSVDLHWRLGPGVIGSVGGLGADPEDVLRLARATVKVDPSEPRLHPKVYEFADPSQR
jgi:hypothetical protein